MILKSIEQGQGLRSPHEHRTFKVYKLFILWLFVLVLWAHNQPMAERYGRIMQFII